MNDFLFFNLNRYIDTFCNIDFPENFNWYHFNIRNIAYHLYRHLHYFLNCKHIIFIKLELNLKVLSLNRLFLFLMNFFFINTVLGFNNLVNFNQKFFTWFIKSGYLNWLIKDFTLTLPHFKVLKRDIKIVRIDVLLC